MKAFISPHWFTFSIPKDLTDAELETLCTKLFGHGFGRFEKSFKGRNGYKQHYSLAGLVNIYRDGWMNNRGTTCFDITGTGLDTLGLDIMSLGKFALNHGGNICRIDIACLDTGNHLPYDEIVNCCMADNFKDRVRTRFNRGKGNLPEIRIQPVKRILFGSEKSDNYLVIYDRQRVDDLDFPCINIEQRITNRADCAAIIQTLLDGTDAGEYYAALLRGKLEFLQEGTGRKDTKEVETWWSDFLGDVAARKIKRVKKPRPWQWKPSHYHKAVKNINKLAVNNEFEHLVALKQELDVLTMQF